MVLARRNPDGYRVIESRRVYDGAIFEVNVDRVAFPDGTQATRDVVTHCGAVGIVALDDSRRIVMLEQYRHPVRQYLWELPAGLLDVAGEPAVNAARRELAEEVELAAQRWDTLVDLVSAPGFSAERVRVFLARGLSATPRPAGFTAVHEEADLVVRRVPLDDAVAAVHEGLIVNSIAVSGILAAHRALSDERLLRPSDTPWAG